MPKRRLSNIVQIMAGFWILCSVAVPAEAFLYHAASRSAAKKIMAKGINPSRFKAHARFGKGFYTGKRPPTALAEKGSQSRVLRLKENPKIKHPAPMDLRKPTASKLHGFLGNRYDLRGAYKGTTIGPKAGKKLGRIAGQQNRAVLYRSKVNGGTNVFFPKRFFDRHPGILKPDHIMPKGN